MKTLSISTATANLSIAVNEGQQVIFEKNISDQKNHSVNIIPAIQEVLAKSNTTLAEIEQIAVADGPGSYTGLRIGITTAKILGDRLAVELVGVSTLEALAANVSVNEHDLIVALLDARNDNFFAGIYRNSVRQSAQKLLQMSPMMSDQHISLVALLEKINNEAPTTVYFVGDYQKKHQEQIIHYFDHEQVNVQFLPENKNIVHAGEIGRLSESKEKVAPAAMLPRYLRKTQAEVEWEQRSGESSLKDDSEYVEEV